MYGFFNTLVSDRYAVSADTQTSGIRKRKKSHRKICSSNAAVEPSGCSQRDVRGCRGVICFDSVSYDGKECRVEVITLACCQ